MTTYRITINTYRAGDKNAAYQVFQSDENANDGVTFERFCAGMDRAIEREDEEARAAAAIPAGYYER